MLEFLLGKSDQSKLKLFQNGGTLCYKKFPKMATKIATTVFTNVHSSVSI